MNIFSVIALAMKEEVLAGTCQVLPVEVLAPHNKVVVSEYRTLAPKKWKRAARMRFHTPDRTCS